MTNTPEGHQSNFTKPPIPNANLLTPEQAVKRTMFSKVALLYGFRGEAARYSVDNLVINLDPLKGLAKTVGYYYGIPPHSMSPELVDEVKKVGASFLKGSQYEGRDDKYLDAGLDIFKTISVEPNTSEFTEWQQYLEEKTVSLQQPPTY